MHVLKEDLNKATLRFKETLNYTDTPAWKEVVDSMTNKDRLYEGLKERNSKVQADFIGANSQVNNYSVALQD